MCLEGARDYSKDVQRLVQGSPMVFKGNSKNASRVFQISFKGVKV